MGAVNLPPQIPVAVFLTRFEPGGTERQMTELIRRLSPDRFAVHVACFERAGAWLPRVAERAASIVEFPIRGFARPDTVRQLARFARWCRRERIAVVQTCDLYANIFALPGAALAGVPVRIGSRRELNPDKSAGQIWLQRQAYRAATRIVANSSAARHVLESEGVAPAAIAVVPNGVDLAAFPERPADALLASPRTVVTVANLRAEKGHEVLIAAAALLAGEFPAVEFRIVGDGPRRADLERRVRSAGLERQVTFAGHREDVAGLLAGADLFVLPSRSEAFPNSVIEAMAAGLPVVGTQVGGLLDLVDHDRTGLLVKAGDAEALASAMRRLLRDRPAAARLGRAARACIAERYSFDRMVRAFEDLYLTGLRARALTGARRAELTGI